MRGLLLVVLGASALTAASSSAEAQTCKQLRALCWTMRAADSDCTEPYRRCLKTGTFVTPLGRRFKATAR